MGMRVDGGNYSVPEDSQAAWYWDSNAEITTKQWADFQPIPRLRLASQGEATAAVTGLFRGARVDLRMVVGREVARPGTVSFSPTAGSSFASFIFASTKALDSKCHWYTLQWRSPTGRRVTSERGVLVVHYEKESSVMPHVCQ